MIRINQIAKIFFSALAVLLTFSPLQAKDFTLTLRSSLDSTLEDARFMQLGWRDSTFTIPSPPAPPGNSFYIFMDRYLFKDFRAFEQNKLYQWDFYFKLSGTDSYKIYYINQNHVAENTDYAAIVDKQGNIRFDLRKVGQITLDNTFNDQFQLLILPKGSDVKPLLMPGQNNKIASSSSQFEPVEIDLKKLFIFNPKHPQKFELEAFGSTSVKYEVSADFIMTVRNNNNQHSLTARIHAENANGISHLDITIQFAVVTDIDSSIDLNTLKLDQNYPNPFNPTTTIGFQLAKTGYVILEVFNSNGQKVSTLVDKVMVSGGHQVSFDASNLVGGVYIYRMRTSEQLFTKKMTLLK